MHAHGRICVGQQFTNGDIWLSVEPDSTGSPILSFSFGPEEKCDPAINVFSIMRLDPHTEHVLHTIDSVPLLQPSMLGLRERYAQQTDDEADLLWAACGKERRQDLLTHVYIEVRSRVPMLQVGELPLRKMWADSYPSVTFRGDLWVPWSDAPLRELLPHIDQSTYRPPIQSWMQYRVDDPAWLNLRFPGGSGIHDDLHESILIAYFASSVRRSELGKPSVRGKYFATGRLISKHLTLAGLQRKIHPDDREEVCKALGELRRICAELEESIADSGTRHKTRSEARLAKLRPWILVLEVAMLELSKLGRLSEVLRTSYCAATHTT